MFRQAKMLNDSTLREDFLLPSISHPILLIAKKLYDVIVMFLFTGIAIVVLLLSAIVAAVFSPAGTQSNSRDEVMSA
ncbi:MAG: hypothetical protein F6K14_13365 [Symploca sp. SIO2C1]|nr:hypothetical protein [Symploca sp. SIO2C1]